LTSSLLPGRAGPPAPVAVPGALPWSRWFRFTAGLRGEQRYLQELEALRGLAILLVFVFHAWGMSGLQPGPAPSLALAYIIQGNTGVTLFFVLSGFLLSLPWLRHALEPGAPRPSTAHYLQARILRIAPMYYAALLFAAIALQAPGPAARAAAFLFIGYDLFPYSAVWWTLVTEVQFYLALPLIMALWLRGGAARLLLAGLLAAWAATYTRLVVFGDPAQLSHPYLWTQSLLGRLPAFGVGIASAACYLRARARPGAGMHPALGLALCLASLLALGLLLQQVAALPDPAAKRAGHLYHTGEALLWALCMLALLLSRFPGKGMLVNGPLAAVGKLSYSLYLVHVPILFYLIYPVRSRLGDAAYADSPWLLALPAAALLAALALSFLCYRLIELPFLQLKHRVAVGAGPASQRR
jgi:peptidoglycan/LPS O-acetylase OafA/YrhL